MKVVMFSTDAAIFTPASPVRTLMGGYGTAFGELHILVYTRPGFSVDRINTQTVAYPTNTHFRFTYFMKVYRMAARLVAHDQSTILTAQEPMGGLVCVLLKWRYGVRVQLQAHADYASPYFGPDSIGNRIRKHIFWHLISHVDCVRVVSQRLARAVARVAPQVPLEILPIRVPIDTIAHARTDTIRAAFPQYDYMIGMAGRLETEKDYETALNSMQKVCVQFPHAGLLIAGSGTQLNKLKSYAYSCGLKDTVQFLGHISDVAMLLKRVDVVLVTSRYEGYGRMLVEAAAAGTAIVTTDVGLVGDVLIANEHALVCPVGDMVCLAQNVCMLLHDPDMRARLGAAAHAAVSARAPSTEEYFSQMRDSLRSCGIQPIVHK
jgi:glycosyltransferase involved in cell wall biosynthesis